MITTTTTTAVAISSGLIGSLALLCILFLVGVLIAKEISDALISDRARQLSQTLTIALVPLGVLFVTTLVFRLATVLS